jgi:hypothetical protein
MIFPDDYEDQEENEDERPMPDMPHVHPPEPCSVCGKPGAIRGCMRCGQPVCIHPENYMADSTCGGWIMDWWSNGAMDPDDGNEFWCKPCLKEVYGDDTSAAPANAEPLPASWTAPAPALPVGAGAPESSQGADARPIS